MKVGSTHPSIAPDAHTRACITFILAQTATLGTPFAVWHLEQRNAAQLVNLTKRHSRHVQCTHEMHPLSHIGFLKNAAWIWTQFAHRVLDASLAGFTEPRSGRWEGVSAGHTGRVWYSIARLMNCDATTVTFDNFIDAIALVTKASTAYKNLCIAFIKLWVKG